MPYNDEQMATDSVQEIKDKLSIMDVVGAQVKLKRAGKSLQGLCPFHKEKTPSFHVNPDRGSYHCFGCGEGGDIFTFTEKIEGLDFKGALKLLAERAGVTLVYSQPDKNHDKRDRLYAAMSDAEQFFVHGLGEDTPAYAYAQSRGLTKETIEGFSLGFAPDEWRALLDHLSAKGYTVQELLEAGLIKEADGKPGTYYDRFRGRLMFPIKDGAGRTVAFTGRTLPTSAKVGEQEPAKYLNSPETELFKKSAVLFGMHKAKDAIRTRGFVILMEGQMDVLHAHQAGFTNTVALSGTALGDAHIALMKRYAENLMLSLDADKAGLAASAKSAEMAIRMGMRVKAVRMPLGKDPADVISEDPKRFAKMVTDASSAIEFFLAILGEGESSPHRLVLAVEKTVLPLVAAIGSPLEREHFIRKVAERLETVPEAVREAVGRIKSNTPTFPSPQAGNVSIPAERQSQRESLELLLRAVPISYPNTPFAKHVESEYSRIVVPPASQIHDVPERTVIEVGVTFGEDPGIDAADDLIRRFEKLVLNETYQAVLSRLRSAQATGDDEAAREAESTCATLAKQIASLSY